MPNPPQNPIDYVYMPSRAARVALTEFERRLKNPLRVQWGLEPIDQYLIPMIPGDLVAVVARPNMGKTISLIHLAYITNQVLREDEVVIYAGYESLIEEFVGACTAPISTYTLEDIGRGLANMPSLEQALNEYIKTNIIAIGRSMETPPKYPTPTLPELGDALEQVMGQGYKIRLLLIDYLQAIPPASRHDIRNDKEQIAAVSGNMKLCKELALQYKLPAVLAIQATRKVDDYSGLKFPLLNDGQWTSNIEQVADKQLALTKPAKYLKLGQELKRDGFVYQVTPNMFGLKVVKQRWGPSDDKAWLLSWEAHTGVFTMHEASGEEVREEDF